jgi:hypothetical protein
VEALDPQRAVSRFDPPGAGGSPLPIAGGELVVCHGGHLDLVRSRTGWHP